MSNNDLEEAPKGEEQPEEDSEQVAFVKSKIYVGDDRRKCRDVFFLILFLLFWLGMVIIAAVAVGAGEPKRLIYGADWNDNVCGAGDMADKKYTVYPDLGKDVLRAKGCEPDTPGWQANCNPSDPLDISKLKPTGECVKECPKIPNDASYVTVPNTKKPGTNWYLGYDTQNLFFRCLPVKTILGEHFVKCSKEQAADGTLVDPSPGTPGFDYVNCNVTQNDCEQTALLKFPNCTITKTKSNSEVEGPTNKDPITEQLGEGVSKVMRWIGDIEASSSAIVVAGALVPIFGSLFWLFFVGKCASLVVTFVVLTIIGGMAGITFYFAALGNIIDATDYCTGDACANLQGQANEDEAFQYKIAFYVAVALDIVVLFVLIFMRSRLRLAARTIQTASVSINKRPMLYVFPFLPSVISLGFFIYFLFIGAYLASSGEDAIKAGLSSVANSTLATVSSNTGVSTNATASAANALFEADQTMQALMVYHLLGWLWMKDFIAGVVTFVTASVIAGVYWKDDHKNAVRLALRRAFRYNVGSICFGSLILALVELARIILTYIDHKLKKAAEHSKVIKMAMCALKIYGWCLQKCVEFISTNAYILMAHGGESFCTAAREAFTIIVKNLVSVGTVQAISAVLMHLGKFAITALCLVIFNAFLEGGSFPGLQGEDIDLSNISSPVLPCVLVVIMAYAIATYFLNILAMAIDTILMCHMIDEKTYEPKYGALFAEQDPALKATLESAKHPPYAMAIYKNPNVGARAAHSGKAEDDGNAPVPADKMESALANTGGAAEGEV